MRGVGRGGSRNAVLIQVITWATQCSVRHTEGTERTDGRGLQAAGGKDWRSRQGREMVEDGRGGCME